MVFKKRKVISPKNPSCAFSECKIVFSCGLLYVLFLPLEHLQVIINHINANAKKRVKFMVEFNISRVFDVDYSPYSDDSCKT